MQKLSNINIFLSIVKFGGRIYTHIIDEIIMKNIAIILAGGTGNRFGIDYPKQFVKLSGRLIIEHTIDKFEKHHLIDEIIVVVHKNYYHFMEKLIQKNGYKKINKLLIGGETRQESSKIGIFAIDYSDAKVIIHDSVRPFVSTQKISEVINSLDKWKSVDVAIPSTDTIIKVSEKMEVIDFPIRDQLMRGQTPQGFLLSTIKEAHHLAEIHNYSSATDDCSLVYKYKLSSIKVIPDDEYNIKLTFPLDIHLADKIFQIYQHKLSVFDIQNLNAIFTGKIIVIFGGTSGIGWEIKKLCDYFNCKTYVFSRRNGTDITNYSDIKNALRGVYKENQNIDAVICTAGILKMDLIENMSVADIVDQINTNLISNICVAKASIKYLKETKGSLIFFASSSYTYGRKGYTPYSASKAGLVNFVQGLADELSDYSIKVNVINPERTNTPMRLNSFGKEDHQLLLTPEYVAIITLNTIATDITGAVIEVRKIDEVPIKLEDL